MGTAPTAIAVSTGAAVTIGAAAALTFSTASSAPAAITNSRRNLCIAGEQPLFACPIGRKLVSVCGDGRGATYRFGVPGRVELSSNRLTTAHAMYSGGGERQVSFANNGFSYIVFDRAVRQMSGGELGGTGFSAGLLVRRGERTVSEARCLGDATMSSDVEKLLPAGPLVYHN
ncbi:hypothetical protein [Sphingomonas sp.]|uniref:hypothetical protein n=1 Tax=Sphingomonas sp. TaxID=28214 RepID=UPI003B007700